MNDIFRTTTDALLGGLSPASRANHHQVVVAGLTVALASLSIAQPASAQVESPPSDETSEEAVDAEAVEDDVDDAVERARQQAETADGTAQAEDYVDQAYDAALIRTDIELDSEHDEDQRLLEDESITDDLDADRAERLRAFFDRFADDSQNPPAPLVRLRQVGDEYDFGQSSHLQLQPLVPDPKWDEAMAYLADDDCDDALDKATEVLGPAHLHTDGEPAVAYAFGRMKQCADSAQTRRSGRQIMEELTDLDSPYARLAAEALGRNADNPDVDDQARGVRSHIRAAERRAERGEVDEALADLIEFRAGLDRGWHRHQVRLAEASILEQQGRVDEAAMAYRAVYRKTSSWRSSDNIASRIEDAEDRLDRTIITFGDRVDRMRALIGRGRYRQARQVSRENVDVRDVSGSEVRGWTRYRQALQSERDRNRERAVGQFEEADDLIADPEVRPRMYFGWARALRRTDADTEAIELYDRICQEYPTYELCERSLYEAGRLLQYQNQHQEARKRFSTLVGLHPFSDRVPYALWRYSLSAYLEEDYERAIPPLKAVVEHHGDIEDRSELSSGLRARYWIGVNYLKNGDEAAAQHWLQNAIDHGPFTWYGQLARTRLEDAQLSFRMPRPPEQLDQDEIENFATLRIPDNPRLRDAAALTRIGLYEEALAKVREHENLHPAPEKITQFRAALHLAVDEPNWAHWIMKSVIGETGPTHRSLRDWGFAFPLNYFELSRRYGNQFDVSPYLVHAIMRQESGFRPEVSSPVGAMGLMQLMPGTARYTARTFFEDHSLTNRQILDEQTNVRLGTMYIRIHQAHAADDTPMALAGYNAGPASLQSWFDRYGDRQLDAWVESITFAETRGYVRKVMTSYITYKGLYGDGDLPELNLDLPDELRDWGEVPELDEPEEPVSMLMY